jgi:hypothetical protein
LLKMVAHLRALCGRRQIGRGCAKYINRPELAVAIASLRRRPLAPSEPGRRPRRQKIGC